MSPLVSGKNPSLGEMITALPTKGIVVPTGFATTSGAYWGFIDSNSFRGKIAELMAEWETGKVDLEETGLAIRRLVLHRVWPEDPAAAIDGAYRQLEAKSGVENPSVAVRPSATAEDLPVASFEGQQETLLNISGIGNVLHAWRRCYASLFTNRAISYRHVKGFDQLSVPLTVGVQIMACVEIRDT